MAKPLGPIALLSFALMQAGCATQRVIRDHEYEAAVNAYRAGDTGLATRKFPAGESRGFITSVEKSWLAVWNHEWDPQPLQRQAETFDQRKFISLSREAEYFLLQEAEEGYIPAEHEVVLLHLLSSIHFLQLGNTEAAQVELRRSGYVLDRYWDDAALRLWLGALWAACGNWTEAQVDFRRAQELRPSAELKRLAEGPGPQKIEVHFFGQTPLLKWEDGSYAPVFLREPGEPSTVAIRAPTEDWFRRHQLRNTQLRDVLIKSNFMAQHLGGKALTQAERGLNTAATAGIKITAVAAGLGITGALLYVLAKSNVTPSGDAIGYVVAGAAGLATAGWSYASRLDQEFERSVKARDRAKQDDLKIYRLVRFLPAWIAVSAEGPPGQARVTLKSVPGAPQVSLVNHF